MHALHHADIFGEDLSPVFGVYGAEFFIIRADASFVEVEKLHTLVAPVWPLGCDENGEIVVLVDTQKHIGIERDILCAGVPLLGKPRIFRKRRIADLYQNRCIDRGALA